VSRPHSYPASAYPFLNTARKIFYPFLGKVLRFIHNPVFPLTLLLLFEHGLEDFPLALVVFRERD
jgi:hypothetical protein